MSVTSARLDSLGQLLEREYPAVTFAYLFGSRATGHATQRSDVDIAVHLEDAADPVESRLEIASRLAQHLGTDGVDLVVLNSAPLSLAGRILQTRRVLLDRHPFLRHGYESLTARMFHDFRIREHRGLMARAAVVDRDLVRRKAADIDRYLSELEEFRHMPAEKYSSDWKTQRIVERTLHLAIEATMDVADHIVADLRLPVPETAAGAFVALADAGELDRDLSQALARMVAFRNILVHDYARLDQRIVLRVLSEGVEDIRRFRRAVLDRLS